MSTCLMLGFALMVALPQSVGAGEFTINTQFQNNSGVFLGQHPTAGNAFAPTYVPPDDDDEIAVFRNVLKTEFLWTSDDGTWETFVKVDAVRGPDHYDFSDADGQGGPGGPNVPEGFYNGVDLRDAFVTYRGSSTWSLNIGRQIVTWGEALTTRINDVVNPQDLTFAFAFEDLESTRMPIFMVRSVHTSLTPLDLYTEFIVAPGIDPLMARSNHFDSRYEGRTDVGGRVTNLPGPGTRFAPALSLDPFAPVLDPNSGLAGFGYGPTATNNNDIPDPSDGMQYGVRAFKQAGRWQFGGQIWHSHQYTPVFRTTGTPAPTVTGLMYPEETSYGLNLNGALPATWTAGFPLVLRTEVNYTPDKTMNDVVGPNAFVPAVVPGVSEHDEAKYLIGLDLSRMPARWLSKTAPLGITLEHFGTIVEDNASITQANDPTQSVGHVSRSYVLSANTSWNYGTYGLTLAAQYDEGPQNMAWFPSFSYTPPWSANLGFSVTWVGFDIEDDDTGLGLFDNKDMLLFSFNWSLPEAKRTF